MKIEEYLKSRQLNILRVSELSGIPYTTLGDIVRGRTDVDNVSVKVLVKLSEVLGMSMEDVYGLLKDAAPTPELDEGYSLLVKNGKYYITKDGRQSYLCDNTREYAYYIRDIATTYINNELRAERMRSWKKML